MSKTEMKSQTLEIFASKKKGHEGDLIAFLPTGNNKSLVVIVDKKCELYPTASVGEIWKMQLRQEENKNFALATLVSPLQLSFKNEFNGASKVSLGVYDEETQEHLTSLEFTPEAEFNQFVKGTVLSHIRKAGLAKLSSIILERYKEGMAWYKEAMSIASDAANEVISHLKESEPREGVKMGDEVPATEVLKEVWSYLKLDEIPDPKEISEAIYEDHMWVFKNGTFFKSQPAVEVEENVEQQQQ